MTACVCVSYIHVLALAKLPGTCMYMCTSTRHMCMVASTGYIGIAYLQLALYKSSKVCMHDSRIIAQNPRFAQ